jgi:hypothetical protein
MMFEGRKLILVLALDQSVLRPNPLPRAWLLVRGYVEYRCGVWAMIEYRGVGGVGGLSGGGGVQPARRRAACTPARTREPPTPTTYTHTHTAEAGSYHPSNLTHAHAHIGSTHARPQGR